ncbi:MAG TPA: sn-glycerol-3-phosphate ABC transporter ATP-binding protein UgpC [Planctomycetota bacterium]|nr:sn-glycerol-3-phosphate ABC transporter ATP-binding protein UgpC [Planctomycetota bacterium]
MAEVILENITKIFPPKVVAVKQFNLQVADQEFLVLVGPSGCGKSTTLRMIAGLEEITEGTIRIGERVVNDVPPKDRDIAMVFQNYALYPHMTVYKNLAFGLKLRKFPRKEIDERVREAAHILGIMELLDRKPKALSGGQRQRVAVGRAIVRQPKAFLFDEPLSNLDAKLRVEMRAELNKLHNRIATTMIYVTHDQVEAMTLGDRIVVMNEGEIQQVGPPLEIYNNPKNRFVAGFIGTPPMNFLDGRLVAHNGGVAFEEGTATIPISARFVDRLRGYVDREVVFGIRPEDVSDRPPVGEAVATFQLATTVEVVEPLGDEMILYLKTPAHEFLGKVSSHGGISDGQALEVSLNVDKVHVFDAETGENLCLDSDS